MKSAAISKLKATISEYIGFVKAGEEILVTERGKAVARIVPISGRQEGDSKRVELTRRGVLKPGKGRISADVLKDLPMAAVSNEAIQQAIDVDREETL